MEGGTPTSMSLGRAAGHGRGPSGQTHRHVSSRLWRSTPGFSSLGRGPLNGCFLVHLAKWYEQPGNGQDALQRSLLNAFHAAKVGQGFSQQTWK